MSIRKRGKAWEIVIEMGKDADGKRIQETFTFHGKKEDAKLEEARLKHELFYGKFIPNNKATVAEYLKYWLEWGETEWKYNTYRSYKQVVEQYLIPELGHVPLLKLAPMKVQEYYTKQVNKGELSRASIHYHHRILKSAFNYAMKQRIMRDNPTFGTEPPTPDKYRPLLLPDKEYIKVFSRLRPDPRYISYILSVLAGMRRGETCGLRWQDINYELKYIKIEHALKREKGKGLVLDDTKTGKGRVVPVSALLSMELDYQKQRQDEWKEVYKTDYHDEDYIVTWPKGNPIDPDQVTKKFNEVLAELNLPKETRVHDLRHAHATFLLEGGADIKDISDELGHSSIAVTGDIYLNPNVETRRQHVDQLGQRFIQSSEQSEEES